MDPITLIVTALATGAAAAFQDEVRDSVKEGYRNLRDAVKRRLAARPAGQAALEAHESDPETWEKPLTKELVQAGAAEDSSLVEAAQSLMKLLDDQGSSAGKYNISISGSQGVQIGDHSTQTNTFS